MSFRLSEDGVLSLAGSQVLGLTHPPSTTAVAFGLDTTTGDVCIPLEERTCWYRPLVHGLNFLTMIGRMRCM
jgi:hypothetical protein